MAEDILEEQSFYTDKNGKTHVIYPMVLKDYQKVNRLFSKINPEFLFLNLPSPKVDDKGNIILNKSNKPVMDMTSYNAMIELFQLALQEPKEEIEQWIDLKNGVHILDEYRQLSGLKETIKKNMEKMMMESLTSLTSSQV